MKKLVYQLLPRLWKNGRFSGVDADTLKYLKDILGMDVLWCTGVIRHATGATEKVVKGEAGSPYAITDYFDVNPYLADDPAHRMEEFEALVGRVHGAGLKLLIDFVPNHVARENVNFSGDDFYYYPGEALRLPVDAKGYEEFPARASGNAFTPAPGINDWWETVRLNYGDVHSDTWDKMLDVVLFWIARGVDGFRCDMVEMVPPAFLKWLIARVKKYHPEVLFVAEVYQRDKYDFYANEVGFDWLYDKCGLYDTLRAVTCNGASAREITAAWQALGPLQPRMLNFLENHDEQRIASDFFCGKPENAYAALAVSLLLNEAPFMVYFGQEAGERGMQQEGFSGLDGRTSIFDWCKVPALEKPNEKVLARYSDILFWAKTPAFAKGKSYDLCYCQQEGFNPDRHFAFIRSDGVNHYLVVANFGPKRDITVRIPQEALDYLGITLGKTHHVLEVPEKDYVLIHLQ
jgi:glycosidase